MKFGIGQKVFVYNREIEKNELGMILSRCKQEKVYRYDCRLERGVVLEFLSTNPESIFFINEEMTNRFFNRLNSSACD